MLDDVLRWLVQVTGLEPKLLTLTAILMVYSASVYLNAKKGVAGVAPAQPLELCDLADAVVRVESGVETVATYLVNLEKYLDDVRLYGSFLTPYVPPVPPQEERTHMRDTPRPRPEKYPSPQGHPIPPEAGIDPRRHGRPQMNEEEPYFPVPVPITPKSEHPGFFLPLPQAEDLDAPAEPKPEPEELPVQPPVQPDSEPQPVPEPQPSPAVRETLRIMSRKAGRTPQ